MRTQSYVSPQSASSAKAASRAFRILPRLEGTAKDHLQKINVTEANVVITENTRTGLWVPNKLCSAKHREQEKANLSVTRIPRSTEVADTWKTAVEQLWVPRGWTSRPRHTSACVVPGSFMPLANRSHGPPTLPAPSNSSGLGCFEDCIELAAPALDPHVRILQGSKVAT